MFPHVLEFPRAWAKLFNLTPDTIRLAREAASSPMPDQQMAEERPFRLRHQLHQIEFDFLGGCGAAQIKTLRKARDVCVDDHSNVDVENVAQHNVRRLSSNALERVKFIHGTRYFTTMVFDELLAARSDVLRLV